MLCLSHLEAAVDRRKWSPSGMSDKFSPHNREVEGTGRVRTLAHASAKTRSVPSS